MAYYQITLKYQEKEYSFIDPFDYMGWYDNDDEYQVTWMYTEGNFACDCNKSIFLIYYCDVDMEPLPCGQTIVLISIQKVQNT